jgi:oligosaccharide repeat unit polymerase
MRAIYILLLATLLFSFWEVITRLRSRYVVLTPILGWIVGLGFFILAPLTFIVLNHGYAFPDFYGMNDRYAKVDLSNTSYFIPFMVIWLSLLLSFMVAIFSMPRPDARQARREVDIDESRLRRIIFTTAGLALLDYSLTIWLAGGVTAFLLSNWYGRVVELTARLGDSYVFYSWLSQANQTVFTAAAALYTHVAIKRSKVSLRLLVLIVLLFLLHIAIQGDRIFFALYLLSTMTSCWLYGRKKLIAALLMVAPLLALIFSAWAYLRNDLTKIVENIPAYAEQDLGSRAAVNFMDACDGEDTVILFHIINDFGGRYDYMYGVSYARVFFFMVPRWLFPEKPPGFAIQLAAIYEPGETTSLAATQLGELYANFGAISVVLLPLITLVISRLSDRLMLRIEKHVFLCVVLFLLFMWSVRATFEDNFITFLLATFLIWGLRLTRGLCSAGPPIKPLATAS